MTLSWKLLFVMLKIKDLVTKLFFIMLKRKWPHHKIRLALYSISIYDEYVHLCAHMCNINMHLYSGAYVFSCLNCYLGFTRTVLWCISPVIRFNKVYWLFLQLFPFWGFCTVISLRYHAVSWLGLHIDICMYICISDRYILFV